MMGCCLGRDFAGTEDSDDLENTICIGKNRPLIHDYYKWESEVAMTEGQLRSKRDEFWETAPAFEGRREIWDALRAAAMHAEQRDFALAQAILDGANISLPNGTLTETYDELGNRYQIPIYCLYAPSNLVEEKSESSLGSDFFAEIAAMNRRVSLLQQNSAASAAGSDSPANSGTLTNSQPTARPPRAPHDAFPLFFRVSNVNHDIEYYVRPSDTIVVIKHSLHAKYSSEVPPPSQQRMFFGGRLLQDKTKIGDYKLKASYVVQLIVSQPKIDLTVTSAALDAKPGSSVASHGTRGKVRHTLSAGSATLSSQNSRSTNGHARTESAKDRSIGSSKATKSSSATSKAKQKKNTTVSNVLESNDENLMISGPVPGSLVSTSSTLATAPGGATGNLPNMEETTLSSSVVEGGNPFNLPPSDVASTAVASQLATSLGNEELALRRRDEQPREDLPLTQTTQQGTSGSSSTSAAHETSRGKLARIMKFRKSNHV